MTLLKLFTIGLLTVLTTAGIYMLESRSDAFNRLPYMIRQIVIGCVFGVLAVLGTEFGIAYHGETINAWNVAPICAGLIFGGPAGIISAVVGSAESIFATYWGVGAFIRIAGITGLMFSGLFSAFIRKYLFENRRTSAIYAVAVGFVCETFHLMIVFMSSADNFVSALETVIYLASYMITTVALVSGASSQLVNYLMCKKGNMVINKRGMSRMIGTALIVTMVIASLFMVGFNVIYQDSIARQQAERTLDNALDNVVANIESAEENADNPRKTIITATRNRRIGNEGLIVIMSDDFEPIVKSNSVTDSSDGKYDVTEDDIEELQEGVISLKNGEMGLCRMQGGNDFYYMKKSTGDYVVLGLYPKTEADVIKWSSVLLTAFAIVVVLTAFFVQIYILIRKIIIKNIREINVKLTRITEGDLDAVVEAGGSREFISLSDDINSTVSALKHYIQEAETRMNNELEIARDIQYSALSKKFPEDSRFELYANMKAAREVGGDFYDFYKLNDDRIAFLIADVSGKGIPAALFMMKSKTLIKSLVESGAEVSTVLTKANEELCMNNEAEMFVTAWLGILDLKTNKIIFSNAGHNRPVLLRRGKKAEFLRCRSGFVLAGMEGIKYKTEEIQFDRGDCLLLYTDGVTEAVNENGSLYGDDRLLKECSKAQDMSPDCACRYIKKSIDGFAGGAPQFDDITMLAIKIRS